MLLFLLLFKKWLIKVCKNPFFDIIPTLRYHPKIMTNINKKRLQVLILAFCALFMTTWLELLLQRKQDLIGGGINRPFLFLLINIHVIAIVILLYIIVRKSIKFIVERRKNVPGSLFKRNLLFAFTFFSVIPSFFVFFTAGKFITTSIDDWFHARISTGLESSLQLHKEQTKEIRQQLMKRGEHFLQNPATQDFNTYIWQNNFKTLLNGLSPEANIWRTYRKKNDRSIKSLKVSLINKINGLEEETPSLIDFYGCLYWIYKTGNKVITLVHRYPETIRDQLITIQNSLDDYYQLKSMKNPIYTMYIFIFILVTLLILFLSIWCAFYLSKGLSKPIQDLLTATKKMRKGRLDIVVPETKQNDLQTLTHGFNEMVGALRSAHVELKRKNSEMLTILENIKASVFFINKFGRVVTYNRAAKELAAQYLNVTRFKNKKISFFGHDITKKFFTLLRKMVERKTDMVSEEMTFSFQNQTRVLMIHMSSVSTSTPYNTFDRNVSKNLLVVIEDLTDIVKLSKMRTWREAAKQVAHEIKNPLTPIQLSTQRLQRKYKELLQHEPTFLNCTDTILKQVTIIKNLASYFSEFASLPTPKLETTDLKNLIHEIAQLYKLSYPGIQLSYDTQATLPPIKTDRKKIKRVFINLFDNSMKALDSQKYTSKKKCVTIKTKYHAQTKNIEILFSDNGPGIQGAIKDSLFLPYVSSNKKNTGLGMAIVHDIVTQLGGSIELLPSSDGATFQILLPT